MTKRAAIVLAVVVVATLAVSGVALAKTSKFTFEGVTLVDGELVIEDGVIEAGSKVTQQNKNNPDGVWFTNCSYYTEAYEEYLGQYGDDTSFADSEDLEADVKAFCVEHFPDRVE